MIAAARALGEGLSSTRYPSVREMQREAFFNEFNPFWKAPIAYGFAVALLAITLGAGGISSKLGRGLYVAGMAGLVAGIGLEVGGVRDAGPDLGLGAGDEHVRDRHLGLAGRRRPGPGLRADIPARPSWPWRPRAWRCWERCSRRTCLCSTRPSTRSSPVLRSNYWLTIHVLTEVSSYAAFALAMGLGLIATLYYLTATYRRSPRFMELAVPLVPGLPFLTLGITGLVVSYGLVPGLRLVPERALALYYAAATLSGIGGVLSIVGTGALLGELVSRWKFRHQLAALNANEAETVLTSASALESEEDASMAMPASTSVQTLTIGESGSGVRWRP